MRTENIRLLKTTIDMEAVVHIWLQASLIAHDFIAKEYWQKNAKTMQEHYLPQTSNWVYEEDGELLGFYAVSLAEEKVVLHALFVNPNAQGRGIGSKLMKYLKGNTKGQVLELQVYSLNHNALHFYKQHGFQVIEESVADDTGEGEVLMRFLPHNNRRSDPIQRYM